MVNDDTDNQLREELAAFQAGDEARLNELLWLRLTPEKLDSYARRLPGLFQEDANELYCQSALVGHAGDLDRAVQLADAAREAEYAARAVHAWLSRPSVDSASSAGD